jgi:hypothetical protein
VDCVANGHRSLFWGRSVRNKQASVSGKCKNQTKALKRSVQRLKQAFDARLRGTWPALAGSFEPKWVGM